MKADLKFYQGKKVFITGHTGFKGSWLSLWLKILGAEVTGYSLAAESESLFNLIKIEQDIKSSIVGDIRNLKDLKQALKKSQPEIIIHMAAQSLVRKSYFDPITTYETNVMGTLNLFEAARDCKSVTTILNITTDKCYENKEQDYAYKEEDPLGGYDPYSSSKACAEILTASYRRSFLEKSGINVASARAGNVIGGGDFSEDRIIPDIIRAIKTGKELEIRSPNAIRPWQHVLEPLHGYLILTKKLYENGREYAGSYNFGPDKDAEINVETLAAKFLKQIGQGKYKITPDANLHEAGLLKLDNNKAKTKLNWYPQLSFDEAISLTSGWYKNYLENSDIKKYTLGQIANFVNQLNK